MCIYKSSLKIIEVSDCDTNMSVGDKDTKVCGSYCGVVLICYDAMASPPQRMWLLRLGCLLELRHQKVLKVNT